MKPLTELLTEEFRASIGAVTSPKALRRHLYRCAHTQAIRAALAWGQISEETIRRFVEHLMCDFVRGQQFPHELALATLAVALEPRKTAMVEDYLLDLARLSKFEEMDYAPRVAALCLVEWLQSHKVVKKTFPGKGRLRSYWSAVPRASVTSPGTFRRFTSE